MAQDTPKIGFKQIHLLKTNILGIGAYGIVYKAMCDGLHCAAKIIHQTLFDPNVHEQVAHNKEHRLPISRFMQECEFMSAIKHPNIVQFLGIHQDPQTGLPVLLTELMDDSLTHFLESSQDAVPYHIQVNFCHNITLAISYLHLNGITHRDLSSNNVLLRGNVQAKVTDFGMAKLGDINPIATRVSFTLCPGTDAYMPPEAVQHPAVYTEKIDCFAIGALIIQILTRCFPKPGNRHKIIHTNDRRFPTIEARVSEIERRQNHISLVDPNHLLLPIPLDCLKDSDTERPSAQELCDRVSALKETPQFTESARRAQKSLRLEPADMTLRVEELQQQVEVKDEQIRQMRQEYAHQIQELQGIIESQNNQLWQNNDIIQDKDQIIAASQEECQQLQECIRELEQQLKRKTSDSTDHEVLANPQPSLDPPLTPTTATATNDSFMLRWREGKEAPCKMCRGSSAVDGEIVYFRPSRAETFNAYNSRDKTWNELPECPNEAVSLAVIQNSLLAIGGRDRSDKVTNQLLSLMGESKMKRWKEVFPPLPTKRSVSIALTTTQALIVSGGLSQDGKTLKTVEIMDINTRQWSSAADLPEPLDSASITICNERVYIGGGESNSGDTKSVYTCTLSDLFLSGRSRSLRKRLVQSLILKRLPSSAVWSKIADLPVIRPTCIAYHDRLLAIGGCDSEYNPTTEVRIYHPTSDTWEVINKMKTSRWRCFAAVLPTNELMVVGGYATNSVEIAMVV